MPRIHLKNQKDLSSGKRKRKAMNKLREDKRKESDRFLWQYGVKYATIASSAFLNIAY